MSEYSFVFIWIAVIAFISLYFPIQEEVMVLGRKEVRWKLFWAFLAFLPVIHLAGMGTARSDTAVYIAIFENSQASLTSILEQFKTHESGFGYRVFQDVVKIIVGGNVTAFRIVLAFCHSIPIILTLRKYSAKYIFSVYLFVATGCHLAWMMNGLRQFLAVSIIFAGTTFIFRKKYIPICILILIAATVHTSALVMLPVIFIVQGRAWNKKTLIYIFAAVVAMFVFSRRIELADALLQGTEYEGAISNMQRIGDDGVNPFRILVSIVPVALAYSVRKIIDDKNDPVLNICINMSIINVGILLVAMVTSGIMIGRLPIYVSLYNFILLPYLVMEIRWGDVDTILKIGSVVGYALYYYILYRGWF